MDFGEQFIQDTSSVDTSQYAHIFNDELTNLWKEEKNRKFGTWVLTIKWAIVIEMASSYYLA